MKILQIIQKAQLRGAEIFACQLSANLQLLGHEVIIVVLFNDEPILPFDGKIIYLNRAFRKRFADLKGWRSLAQIIKSWQPDIIQANAADTLKYAVASKLLFRWRTPVVYRNASMMSRYIKGSLQRFFYQQFFKNVDRIASVSNSTASDFGKLFPTLKSKVAIIPVGVDFNKLDISDTVPAGKVVIHIGGFSFEKNHKGLLRIFAKVKRKVPEAQLWLIGEGPLRKAVQNEVERQGLKGVAFYGHQSDVGKFLSKASVLVLPSIIEGLPAVILEAFASKVPVVAYNVGAISELVVHHSTGWLVGLNDEEGFAQILTEVLADRSAARTYVKNAFDLVRQNFDNKRIAEEFEILYRQLK